MEADPRYFTLSCKVIRPDGLQVTESCTDEVMWGGYLQTYSYIIFQNMRNLKKNLRRQLREKYPKNHT